MGKIIDSPPVWTLVMLVTAWAQVTLTGPVLRGFGLGVLGWLLIGAGISLTVMAAREFRRAETTILPHAWPTDIITTGIFSRTRNPIYVADTVVIAGVGLILGAWSVVVLIPIFMRIITWRFIEPEEAKLVARFREAFEQYRSEVPRWLWGGRVPVGNSRTSL